MWRLSTGLAASHAVAFPAEDTFHGYPTLPETLPPSARSLPYVYASAVTESGGGDEIVVRIALDQPGASLSLEAGRAMLPAGKSIAIRVQTAPLPGVTAQVRLDVSGLPPGVHAQFAPEQVAPGETATLALQADPTTAATSATCVLGMTAGTGTASMTFRLDVFAAPAVSLQGPVTGAVLTGATRVDVTAGASEGTALAEVRLLVDGATVASASGSPASFTWDTAEVADGAHDLAAMALDELGNSTTTAPLRVGIRNGRFSGGCGSAGAEQSVMALAAATMFLLRARRRLVR
jgi:hypothetical protein